MEAIANEIIVVKRITTNAWVKDLNSINKDKITGSFKSADGTLSKIRIGVGTDKNTGKRKSILTLEEQEDLEKALHMTKGTLASNSDYWIDFTVDIESNELILKPDENPMDRLRLKVLKSKSFVANSMSEINAYSEYVIMSETEEAKKSNVLRGSKKEAYAAFAKMSPAEMEEVLIAMGKKPTNVSNEIIEDSLGREIDANPAKFLTIVKNPKFKQIVYLTRLVNLGILTKKAGAYIYESELIGLDVDSAIHFLNDKENVNMVTAINATYSNKIKEQKENI